MNNGNLVILPYVVIYEDVLHILVEGVNPKWLPPTDGEGITSPPKKDKQNNNTEIGKKGQNTEIRLNQCCLYHSKWSWNPPRPWTELRYWYRPRSPSWVDTRSSSRVNTIPLLLQRIFPMAIFTFNWNRSRKKYQSSMWENKKDVLIY